MVKKRGKRKKRKTKVKFKRAPSKLPANRVVSANQYLHLQRQIDEMKMVPTRGNRQADYHASQGNPYASASAAQREIIDTLRMTPDIVKDLEKKKQDDRFKDLTDANTKLSREVDQLQQHSRQQAQNDASSHTA